MEDRILDAITSAFENAGFSFDTDGTSVWVDDPETKKTYYVSIGGCES